LGTVGWSEEVNQWLAKAGFLAVDWRMTAMWLSTNAALMECAGYLEGSSERMTLMMVRQCLGG
jgi:hypothetical protein